MNDDHYKPDKCTPVHKVAKFVPYRKKRERTENILE